ncbi:hypothetical protein [Eubacterium pyruvativorans]|uniref:hypothetical protein n=1 Tax=Eubacterium pyruvativorans TaxID=155865 RepID=UPI0015674D19|nr:hypothetical protein [Eubacterium pyruvativorans]
MRKILTPNKKVKELQTQLDAAQGAIDFLMMTAAGSDESVDDSAASGSTETDTTDTKAE